MTNLLTKCLAPARKALRRTALALALGALAWPFQAGAVGTWAALTHSNNVSFGHMHLLSDGSVMAQQSGGKAWYRFTPDSSGSYLNGTWTPLAAMTDSRLFYSSQVLRDGSVFVAGGEYGSGDATAEIFNPLLDAPLGRWTTVAVPTSLLDPTQASATHPATSTTAASPQGFTDSISEILPDGSVLIAPVNPKHQKDTLIYNPDPALAANPWSAGPSLHSSNWQAEASWVKLPDDSVLTIDPDSNKTERYIPASNTWVSDADVLDAAGQPLSLYYALPGFVGELGPAFLLPDGRAFFLGASGKTAFYTPDPGNTRNTDAAHSIAGHWAPGPNLPSVPVASRDANGNPLTSNGAVLFQTNPDGSLKYVTGSAGDSPAAMMPNGRILFCISEYNVTYHKPVFFCEYDPSANSITPVSGPTGANSTAPVSGPTGGYDNAKIADQFNTLVLPDGNVLFSDTNAAGTLYLYQPDGLPLTAGKPVIGDITRNSDGSYHLTGTGLNGISEGAAYGDESQMATNYPLVQMIDSNGTVSYGRTYNWSSTGVRTGNQSVSTEFSLPPGAVDGTLYSLAVVTNGISSDHVLFIANPPPPLVTISAPAQHSTIAAFPAISGTATDDGGPGIAGNSVNLTLYQINTNMYWDGNGWSSTPALISVPVVGTTWTYSGKLPDNTNNDLGGPYAISAGTHDIYGTYSIAQSGVNNLTVTIDDTPPTLAITSPLDGSLINTDSYVLAGNADDPSGILHVNCFVRRNADGYYWNGSGWGIPAINLVTYYDPATKLWNCTDPLPQPGPALVNGTYTFIAIAVDHAFNHLEADSAVTVDYHPVYYWTGATFRDDNPNNDSHFWDDAANWYPYGVPGDGDIAIINNGDAVDSSAPRVVYGLRIGGNSSLANYSVEITGGTGVSVWSSGTLSNQIIVDAGASLTIDRTNYPYLNGGVINNAGTVVLSGNSGVFYGANNSAINNSGVFQVTVEGIVTQDLGNNAIFNNLPGGTLVKTALSGTATATVDWQLNNGGTVESDSGTLAFAEGSSYGVGSNGVFLSPVAAARIEFSGGIHVLNDGTRFLGPGRGRESSGGVTVAGAVTVGQSVPAVASGFEVTGNGNMDGAGSLSLVGGGAFAWSGGGTISTTVSVGVGCQLTIDRTNYPYLNGGVINNAGAAVLSGDSGVLYGANNSAINNSGGFQITCEGLVTQDLGNNALFNNLPGGTLVKTALSGTGTATVDWQFNNGGTVESDSGTLAFAEGSTYGVGSNGVFLSTVAAARIEFANGNHVLNGGTRFLGPGRGRVSAGSVTLLGAVTGGQSVPAMASGFEVIGNGNMDGAGSLSLVGGGAFAWSGGGTISTTVSVGVGCQLTIDRTNYPYLNGGVINNAGTAGLVGDSGVLYGANNGTINNTGVFQITVEGPVTQDLGNNAIFNNLPGGTLVKTAASGTGTATLGWQLNNGGTVESDSGTLAFAEGSSYGVGSNGVFLSTVAAARIEFAGGAHVLNDGASFRGQGRGRVTGSVTLLGAVTVGQSAPAVPAGGFEMTASGYLGGTGSLSLVGGGGTFAWDGGSVISTAVSVGAGCMMSIDTTNYPVLNGGMVSIAGSAVLSGTGILQGANNAAIINTGVFQVNRSGAIMQNNGNFATFRNDGILNLLPTASSVALGWDFVQSGTGTLNLKIGGTDPATPQFDSIAFGGSVALGGTLGISLINSFVPTTGNAFAVLTYGTQTGSFASVSSPGANFSRNYNAGDFTLTAAHGPTNFAEWKDAYFGAGSPDAADNADPDHDGVSNLMEYATGGNPLHSDPPATSQDPPVGGFIEFYYSRSIIAMAELQFQVEWNDDMSPDGWHSVGVTESVLGDDGAIQQVNAHVPTDGRALRFVHLKVTHP